MHFGSQWEKFIGEDVFIENIKVSQHSCVRDIQQRSIKIILKMKEKSSPDNFSIGRKIN
jgi:hypothetical protein